MIGPVGTNSDILYCYSYSAPSITDKSGPNELFIEPATLLSVLFSVYV